ncbi:hypothetical protein FQN60_018413 [Etheostoma spectabile]|uniref:Uncharacterized protein n=1 Tax=Etheostoma spectabile TaxID=54343 RepID=A0A5J5DIA3_9PERO|nr:hypothetical protein FQN60_018413 [Etheostoma spectabile]
MFFSHRRVIIEPTNRLSGQEAALRWTDAGLQLPVLGSREQPVRRTRSTARRDWFIPSTAGAREEQSNLLRPSYIWVPRCLRLQEKGLASETSAPMDPAFDLSENGRKLAHATASVCSKPTGELGSCYECKMSPVGSGTKDSEAQLVSPPSLYIDQRLIRWSLDPAASSFCLGSWWSEKATLSTMSVWY